MKQKKGFMATSLIYSFFLVFLMLMIGILTTTMNNRILVNSLKEDIRSSLEKEQGFVVDTLENKTYALGEIVSFGNETWQVVTNKANSVVLVLQRSLTKMEIEKALGKSNNREFFGTCTSETSCQVRACREFTGGEEYCFYYPANTRLHSKPTWAPNITQIRNQNMGKTIVSKVVNDWFSMHQGLQIVLEKNKLIPMTFNDGYLNYPESGGKAIYVRIPHTSDLNSVTSWNGVKPFHILNSVGASNELQTRIYNRTDKEATIVSSNTAALIRPVIEAKKG